MKKIKERLDFYIYQSTVASIANAANAVNIINIEADSDFILQKLMFFCDIAGAIQTDSSRVLPLVTVQITDTGSGRQLFSDVVPIPLLYGAGGRPFVLPNPRRFSANGTISISYSNYSNATTYTNLYLGFMGSKAYRL